MHPFYSLNRWFFSQENFWWIGVVSMLLYLLFWAVVFVVTIWLVKKYFLNGKGKGHEGDKALEILRERYARGEIDSQEFQQKKADLEGK